MKKPSPRGLHDQSRQHPYPHYLSAVGMQLLTRSRATPFGGSVKGIPSESVKHVEFRSATRSTLISLGANIAGRWGPPFRSLQCAIRTLTSRGLKLERASSLYQTAPLGQYRQPLYLNAVVLVKSGSSSSALLRELKKIELLAGRRTAAAWAPRPLDLDIVDHGGRVQGWPPRRRVRGQIVLPHPEAHRRAFVLAPLLDVAPHWHHPALHRSAKRLLTNLPPPRQLVSRVLDSSWISCDENPTETGKAGTHCPGGGTHG
jgi:2-amino-4-hydroxy-6-hydroxymethyldihydropteridine diphosphokinase